MFIKKLTWSALTFLMVTPFSPDASAMMEKRSKVTAERKRSEVVTLFDLKWSKSQAAFVASKFVELNSVLGSLSISGLSVLGSGFEPSNPGFDPFKINLNKAFLPDSNLILNEMNRNLKVGLDINLKSFELSYPNGGKDAELAKSKIYKEFQDQSNFFRKTLPRKIEALNKDIMITLEKEGSGYQNLFNENGKRFFIASQNWLKKLGVENFTDADRVVARNTSEALMKFVDMQREKYKSCGIFAIEVDRGLVSGQLLLINKLLGSLPVSELTTLGSGFEANNQGLNVFDFDLGGRSFLPNTKILNQEVELTIKLGFERDRKILELSIPKKSVYEASVKKLEANYKAVDCALQAGWFSLDL